MIKLKTAAILITAAALSWVAIVQAKPKDRDPDSGDKQHEKWDKEREKQREKAAREAAERERARTATAVSTDSSSSAATAPAATSATAPAAAPFPSFRRPAETSQPPGKPLPGEYQLLSRKSIFAKDRRAYVERPRTDPRDLPRSDTNPAPPPPAVPVLVGVLIGDQDLIAYIEDPDSGKLWPLAAGDPLPGTFGTVRRVSLDDIVIAKDGGSEQRILIGQNLAGEAAASRTLTSSYAPSTVASTNPGSTTAPALDPNDPNLTTEQRMKLRRMQQIGK